MFTEVGKYGFVRVDPHDAYANFGRSQEVTTFVKIEILQNRQHETSIQYIQAHTFPLSPSGAHRTPSRLSRLPSLLFSSHTGCSPSSSTPAQPPWVPRYSRPRGQGSQSLCNHRQLMPTEKENAKGPGTH